MSTSIFGAVVGEHKPGATLRNATSISGAIVEEAIGIRYRLDIVVELSRFGELLF
jgi:hypothetical protein